MFFWKWKRLSHRHNSTLAVCSAMQGAVSSSAQRRDVCKLQGRQPSAQRRTPSVRCVHNPAFARAFFWSSCCPDLPVSQSSSVCSLVQFFLCVHFPSTLSRAVCSLFAPDSPFMSYFPPCLLFPDGHFETTFQTATATSLTSPTTSPPSSSTNLKSARFAHSAPATCPTPRSPHVMSQSCS